MFYLLRSDVIMEFHGQTGTAHTATLLLLGTSVTFCWNVLLLAVFGRSLRVFWRTVMIACVLSYGTRTR